MRRLPLLVVLAALAPAPVAGVQGSGSLDRGMSLRELPVAVPAGSFIPRFAVEASPVRVEAFRIDAAAVTVEEWLAFVEIHPEWRRSEVPALFAGRGYLASWVDDLDPGLGGDPAEHPVTEVSWFAARAFCDARGGRLPTTEEWEYLAAMEPEGGPVFRDPVFNARLRALYAEQASRTVLPTVGSTFRNGAGVWDLHGLIWEWTEDFNAQMATGSGRDDQGLNRGLFCAAGSVGATDRSDYAAYLRFALRASLEGADAGPRLGFRCAYGEER